MQISPFHSITCSAVDIFDICIAGDMPCHHTTNTFCDPLYGDACDPRQSGTPGGTPRPIASNQNPVYNGPNWQPPPKLADHLHAQMRSRDGTIVTDYSDQLCLLGLLSDSSDIHASTDISVTVSCVEAKNKPPL